MPGWVTPTLALSREEHSVRELTNPDESMEITLRLEEETIGDNRFIRIFKGDKLIAKRVICKDDEEQKVMVMEEGELVTYSHKHTLRFCKRRVGAVTHHCQAVMFEIADNKVSDLFELFIED